MCCKGFQTIRVGDEPTGKDEGEAKIGRSLGGKKRQFEGLGLPGVASLSPEELVAASGDRNILPIRFLRFPPGHHAFPPLSLRCGSSAMFATVFASTRRFH